MLTPLRRPQSFPKIPSEQIRAVRLNQRIIGGDGLRFLQLIGQQCRQANESGNGLSCGTASHKIDTQDTGQWSSGEVKGDAASYA